MGKGLPRSMSRGDKIRQELVKETITVSGTVTVSATGAAIGYGSLVISGLPQGNILFLGAAAYIGLAGSGSDANLADTWSGDYGIGTTPADDATITGTDVDIIPSTAVGAATAEVIAETRGVNSTQAMFDNTDGSLELNLNVLIDAANITDDESVDLTASGKLALAYIVLLDD
jgi:hypothetical protein